jgi:PhnB protein
MVLLQEKMMTSIFCLCRCLGHAFASELCQQSITTSFLSPFSDLNKTIMTKLNAYITFNGNCEEAFNFYKSAFGGEFLYIGRYKDVPPTDRQIFPLENDEKIMHVTLPISKETVLMGCDSPEAHGQGTIFSNNISLSINTDSKEEADRLFNELSVGGQIKMSMSQTFWGAYFGMLTDRFGINWLISCDSNETN